MPNTTLGSVVSTAGGAGAGLLAGSSVGLGLGGPAGAAIGAGVGALLGLIGDIGSGRRTANTMTQNGGPQDILNKQLAAIAGSGEDASTKAQATQVAWQGFIQATNQFAAQGPEYAQVAKQALYQTPALTQTVQSLMGGVDPLGQQFTQGLSPSIGSATPQSGITLGSIGLPAAAGVAGGLIGGQFNGGGQTVGGVNAPTVGGGDPNSFPGSIGGPPGAATIPNAGSWPVDGAGNPISGGAPSILNKLLPTLISSGTSLLGGVVGSNAANSAAATQAAAANHAADLEAQAAANSLAFQKQTLAQQQANAQPWLTAGSNALGKINDLTATPFTLPTEAEAAATPGYQFQFDQGQAALEAWERSQGKLLGGAAAKEQTQFGQGLASTNYQNAVGNKLTAFNANLNPQLALAGLGQVATGNLNSNLTSATQVNAATNQQGAQGVGQQLNNAAQATASGYAGAGNAINGALSSVGNNFTQASTIQQLLAALQQRQPTIQ